ncbi:MAG: DNA polymerase I [Bacteroidetes bacterium]|jgi:DNA polymerase-1|nr:DNA polymerase I [Bacteroidota bacterium]
MADKKLFLLDGHALVYRAHYAFITRPLINSKGLNTGAITGFVRSLWDILNNQKPTHIGVAFDPKGPTFRHEEFVEYKANRDAQPEDITTAFPYIRAIVEAFNIPIVEVSGFEADDTIGTLAKKAEKEGFKVYMVTPDKDYAQLVSENIFMYKPSRQGNGVDILGVPEVLEKWDIKRVDQVIDILGLQGDSVDNIPGIPGIGAKTAVKLLAKYDTVEGLIENAHELKGKQKEKVEQFAEQGLKSKWLATIDINVPIDFKADELKLEPFDREKLTELFKELEFRSLSKTILGQSAQPAQQGGVQGSLFGDTPSAPARKDFSAIPSHSAATKNIENTKHEYLLMDTPEKRVALIEILSKEKGFCFDTETTGIDANQAELVGMSFSIEAHGGWYVPVPADQEAAKAIVHEFKPLFENVNIEKYAQNIKYDGLMMKWYGVELKGKFFDTMIAHYLLEPGLRHNMDYLSETYLKYQPVSITTLIGKKGKNQLSMRDIPVEKVCEYAVEDSDVTLQLKEILSPKLKEENLKELYDTMEEPLVKALIDMEYEGINLDSQFLNEYSKELGTGILENEKRIYEKAGVKFNIASPKQVGEVLFDKMDIPYRWRKTKTGQYSTDESKLTELAKDHDIVADIMNYRTLAKLKSTYVDALPKMVNPRTGRIHSSFNQALAATGRLSSNNPNLQNIPIKTPEGRKVRKAFIPRDKDHLLLAADYSQIELRIIAEISGDEAMLEAFQKAQDIHRATAAKVFQVDYDAVTADQRRAAKTVNFSIIYGAGSTNLSQQLNIKRAEAKEIITQYFSQYSGLKNYMDKTVEFARENGFVKTLMGRRRYLRDINSRNALARTNTERVAINTPIQGTAADLIKIAMINIHKEFKKQNFKSKMILQVHDELVFDAHKDELEIIKPIIEDKMKHAIPDLKVPLLVGMDTGENWLEAH